MSAGAKDSFFGAEGVSLAFGGLAALSDIGFSVEKGSLQAVIGPNGAGKTSLFNVVTGFYRAQKGNIFIEGRDISNLPPHEVARAGIVRTFQHLEVFPNMSALENVLTGLHMSGGYNVLHSVLRTPRYFSRERALRGEAERWIEFVGLADRMHVSAGGLPYGSLRLLEIARALAAGPKVLLLDEPAAGLNMRETKALGVLVRKIVEWGTTVVMVEHDMELVMNVSDRVLVLNFGEVIAEGTPAEVQKNPQVVAAYLGEE